MTEMNLMEVLNQALLNLVDYSKVTRFCLDTDEDEFVSIARTDMYERYSFNAKLNGKMLGGHFPADTPPLEMVKRIAAMASK